ncbi:hypothetical protein [Mesorhizobium caraganae]|uniref:hypothetical protein n=1 Tax=Mesorhizobium caraganae TaxID=483206 RepID=UPI003338D572
MTPEQERMLAEANERLLAAGFEAANQYAAELLAKGRTIDEINAALKTYRIEQLEPWRVKSYRHIRRFILAPTAPTHLVQ